MKKVIFSEKAPAPIGPYSQAIQFGNELFVSGQIALKNGVMIQDNIQDETHQVMKNLQAILEAAEMTFDHVVKCTIFVKDLNNFQAINEIYGTYFEANPPARETVEVSRLPKDANVEISCIAVK
ncbi:MAG: RidA family protein [Raineya sp.]|jgi:2-iminobutanoate/2-iminopropanoate deaminase|nr:RidA family protein [Raineya sp.]